MKLSELKKVLKELSKEELSEIILDLHKSNNAVKDFLQYHFMQTDAKLIDKFKAEINKAIDPAKHNLKLAKAKKAITDFKKIGAKPEALVELMFYYIEKGLIFSNHFNYRPDNFMNSLLSVYSSAIKLIKNECLPEKFNDWAKITAENMLSQSLPWGQCFNEIYNKNFS